MITHYLKVAVRNLLKYKTQSLISIVGLAIGLATFSLSSIWLKYEMTYDTHWPDAERIYQIGVWNELDISKFTPYTSILASSHLKEVYPEIEASCAFKLRQGKQNGKDVRILITDSTYTHLFPLTILKGNDQFLYDHRLAGITESTALRKINGAKIKDIITLFIKEYGILLILSATLAFAVGYAVMKSWLQNYVIQTPISWWIYASILLSVFLLIVLCVGYRVWKAANENPAEVVKSE